MTSVIAVRRSPMAYANTTSAAALGVVAKQPECILTPPGTPMSAVFIASGPHDSRAFTMSLVVPSPPAYRIASTFWPTSSRTKRSVSPGVVEAGVTPDQACENEDDSGAQAEPIRPSQPTKVRVVAVRLREDATKVARWAKHRSMRGPARS